MVTMNSGSAMLTKAPNVNAGIMNTGRASSSVTADHCMRPAAAACAMPASSVSTTA